MWGFLPVQPLMCRERMRALPEKTPGSRRGVRYPENIFSFVVISGRGVSFYFGYSLQFWVQEGTNHMP